MFSNNSTAIQLNVTNSTATEFDWEPYFYASSPYGELQIVYLTGSLLLAVGGNTAVLLTVLLTEDLRTPGYALLCALATSDILQASTKVPLAIHFLVVREYLVCNAFLVAISAIYMFFTMFAVCIIGPISLDRYWFICSPLRYPDIMTKTRTALLTGVFALLSFVTVLPPLIEEGRDSFFPTYFVCRYEGPARLIRQSLMNTCFAITLATMFFCYFRIWREVRRQQAMVVHLQPAPLADRTQGTTTTGGTQDTTVNPSGDSESGPVDLGDKWACPRHAHVNLAFQLDDEEVGPSEETQAPVQDDPQHNAAAQVSAAPSPAPAAEPGRPLLSAEFQQRLRTAGTVMMVIGVFWATWIPYSVTIFRMGIVGVEEVAPTDGMWQRISLLVSMVSTYSNPIIYAYRNRELRQAFIRLCRHR